MYMNILKQEVSRPNELRWNLNSRPRNMGNTPKNTLIRIYFEAQNDPKTGPFRSIFNISLKVAQIDM